MQKALLFLALFCFNATAQDSLDLSFEEDIQIENSCDLEMDYCRETKEEAEAAEKAVEEAFLKARKNAEEMANVL